MQRKHEKLGKKGRNLKRRYFSEKKMKISSRQSGAVGLERGFSLMMEKYPFQKKKVKTRSERPAAPATCVSVVQKRPVERGPRGAEFFFFWERLAAFSQK